MDRVYNMGQENIQHDRLGSRSGSLVGLPFWMSEEDAEDCTHWPRVISCLLSRHPGGPRCPCGKRDSSATVRRPASFVCDGGSLPMAVEQGQTQGRRQKEMTSMQQTPLAARDVLRSRPLFVYSPRYASITSRRERTSVGFPSANNLPASSTKI